MSTDPKQAHELYQNAFLIQNIRQVALGQTGGHSALVRTLNTAELIAKAEEVRERTRAEARQIGREEASAEAAQREERRREAKVEKLASNIVGIVMALVCLVSAGTLVLATGVADAWWRPGKLIFAFAAIVGAYSAADLFGFTSAASLRRLLERGVGAIIRSLQAAVA